MTLVACLKALVTWRHTGGWAVRNE